MIRMEGTLAVAKGALDIPFNFTSSKTAGTFCSEYPPLDNVARASLLSFYLAHVADILLVFLWDCLTSGSLTTRGDALPESTQDSSHEDRRALSRIFGSSPLIENRLAQADFAKHPGPVIASFRRSWQSLNITV